MIRRIWYKHDIYRYYYISTGVSGLYVHILLYKIMNLM